MSKRLSRFSTSTVTSHEGQPAIIPRITLYRRYGRNILHGAGIVLVIGALFFHGNTASYKEMLLGNTAHASETINQDGHHVSRLHHEEKHRKHGHSSGRSGVKKKQKKHKHASRAAGLRNAGNDDTANGSAEENAVGKKEFDAHEKSGDPLVDTAPTGWKGIVKGVGGGEGVLQAQRKTTPPPTSLKVRNNEKTNNQAAEKENSPATSRNRILIPTNEGMGIAGYQSGNHFIIVIDNSVSLDTSHLHGDGIFSNVGIIRLGAADQEEGSNGITALVLPVPDTRSLYMSQQRDGWVLGDEPPPVSDYQDRPMIAPRVVARDLLFPMRQPGRVFTLKDPGSDRHLIIGTTKLDDGGIMSFHAGNDYDLWPTLEGVVVDDHTGVKAHHPDGKQVVSMRAIPEGDLLSDSGSNPDLDRVVYTSNVDSSWLGLRNLDDVSAETRYQNAVRAASDAKPSELFEKRIEAAKAALGAADAMTARAIMNTALEDDPEEAMRPDVRFLSGAVDFLSGGLDGAEVLKGNWPENPPQNTLRGTRLWQALYQARSGENGNETAHMLARDFDRLLNYPKALKEILLPLAAEHIARYGNPDDRKVLDRLFASEADMNGHQRDQYGLVRALRMMADNSSDASSDTDADREIGNMIARLSGSSDQNVMEKALEQGVLLSLKKNRITPGQAAQQLFSLIPDASISGDMGPLSIMESEAAIKAEDWDQALASLDRAARDVRGRNNPEIGSLYKMAMKGLGDRIDRETDENRDQDRNRLLRDAAMIRAHMNDVNGGPEKADLLVSYGKILSHLGLDEEAGKSIRDALNMIPASREGDRDMEERNRKRAFLGDMLAENLLHRSLYDQAGKVLNETAGKGLGKDEMLKRTHILARISEASGNPDMAMMLLGNAEDPETENIRSRIHERSGNWKQAALEARKMAEALIPREGVVTASQQLLALRVASDASQAGDVDTLSWIRDLVGRRSMNGSAAGMFKTLTGTVNGEQ